MEKEAKIFVAGHNGMVGSAIMRRLKAEGYTNLVTRTRAELDLTRQEPTEEFFQEEKPEYVFLAAALVGGIEANRSRKGDFILRNLQIEVNTIDAALRSDVTKLLFLGSSCIYPKHAEQPITESSLLTGPLEPTNEPYAIAKIAGMKTCEFLREQYGVDFISMMPTNLYGPNDNFDPVTSHVLPALIRKFVEATERGDRSVTLWGSGEPRREFLHADDCADAALFLMREYSDAETVNVGWGKDISIRELAALIAEVVGFTGSIEFDASYPDGTPRKVLDTGKLSGLGWSPDISLRAGIEETVAWFRSEEMSTT